MQFYAPVCKSITLRQCLHIDEAKMCPRGDDCRLSGGRFTQQVMIASFSRLAAYIALSAALVRYAKDKGAFITARQDSQTDY